MSVIDEIAAERRRQIQKENYSADHDDRHEQGEIAALAAAYCLRAAGLPLDVIPAKVRDWVKDHGMRRGLVIASAAAAAEIERLDRTAFAAAHADGTVPTVPGVPFAGGFYAGRIVIDGKTYALVVAPKAEGQKTLFWKNEMTATGGAQSLNDGFANSEAMNDDDHPAAQFCRGLTIGGFTDWYLPSRDELEIFYRNLKPGIANNWTYANRAEAWGVKPGAYNGVDGAGNGSNTSSDPAGEAYSDETPQQTAATAFQTDGSEAFETRWYWSSSEFGQHYAWYQDFDDGGQDFGGKNDGGRVRAVRKVILI